MPEGFVNALDWAYGDGANDDADALNQAAANAASNNKGLWIPKTTATYDIGSQVVIPAGVDVKCYGTLRALSTISKAQPAVVVGASGTANDFRPAPRVELDLDSQAVGGAVDWSSESYVGVRIYNPRDSRITIKRVRGFSVGVEMVADGGHEAENVTLDLGLLEDVRHAVRFTGACRYSIIRNGRWEISSAASAAEAETERVLWDIADTDARGNLWLLPSAGSVPRGSTASSRKLSYLRTKAGFNRIESLGDGASLDVAKGDGHIVADGASATENMVHIGRYGGQALTVQKINGAASSRNGIITRQAVVSNITTIGGVKF